MQEARARDHCRDKGVGEVEEPWTLHCVHFKSQESQVVFLFFKMLYGFKGLLIGES